MQKIICVSCFSQIVLKNNGFKDEYLKDNLIYRCPFCKSNTKINVNVNHAINNNIIKGLIKSQSNDNDEGGLMDRFLDHFMISHNTELLVQNNELKKEIKNLKKELENKQASNIKLLNIATNVKGEKNVLNFKLNEIKNIEIKQLQIKGILNTVAPSTKKSKLYKDLTALLNI